MRWLPLLLSLAACGSTPGPCDWHRCLPSDDAVWIHEPPERGGSEWHAAFAAARDAWGRSDQPPARIHRVSLMLRPLAKRGLAGYVATVTRARAGIVVSSELDSVERQQRVVVHEVLHILAARSGQGVDRGHRLPGVWGPDHESVEARAVCALQPERCP